MKKKIIFLSIFILLLAIGGVGIYYFAKTNQKPFVHANENAKFKTYTAPAPTDGTTPLDHDSYDNIAYVLWVLEHTEHYSSLTEGKAVSVGQSQTIYNHRRVNGKEQLVDMISGGLIPLGKQKYFLDDKVLMRDYVSKDGDSIVWKTAEPECITKDEYIKRYGWLPNQATAYIICKDTILEISEVSTTEDGLFSISLSLNPNEDYAPFWYQREVSTNATSLSQPRFSSIQIEYIFDADWKVQEIKTRENYTVTPKVAPILITCETNITETFDYENYEFDASAMEFFEDYKDLVPVGGSSSNPEENTPLTYITGALLGGSDKEKTFDLLIKVEDREITGKLLLDISDLNNVIVHINLGGLQVVYRDNEVYIDYGSIKLKCNVDEVGTMLHPLLEEILLDTSTSGSSLSGLDIGQIMNDLNSAIITETETSVQLDLTLNLMGVSLPLVFQIDKKDKEFDLKTIQSNLQLGDHDILIQMIQNPNLTFDSLEGEYNDVKNLEFIIEDITTILKNKKVSTAFKMAYEDYSIHGLAKIQFADSTLVQCNLTIENTVLGIQESLVITYTNSFLYVEYEGTKLKMQAKELVEILQKVLPEMPQKDFSAILDYALGIDFKKLFNQLEIKENNLVLSLDLGALDSNLSKLDFTIQNTDWGFTASTNVFQTSIDFNVTDFETISIDETEYSSINEYIELIEFMNNILFKTSIGVRFDGVIHVESVEVGIVGELNFYLNETNTYDVEGTFQIQYEENSLTCKVILIQNEVYLQVLGYTIKVNTETAMDTLNTIFEQFGIVIPTDAISMNLAKGIEVIRSIQIGSNSIEVDMTSILEELGKLEVRYTVDTNLSIEIKCGLVSMNGIVQSIETKEIEVPTEYYDEADILDLLEYVKDVQTVIENKHAYVEISGVYEEVSLKGYVYIDWASAIQAHGVFTISYQGTEYPVEVTYSNEYIYIAYNQIKLKINQETLMDYIQSPMLLSDSIDINQIIEICKRIHISSGNIEAVLDFSSFIQEIGEVIVEIINTESGFNVSLNLFDIEFKLDVHKTEDITVQDAEYSSVEGYLDLINYLKEILFETSLSLHLDGTIHLEDIEVGLSGDVNFYLNQTNTYDVDAAFVIEALDTVVEVRVTYIKQTIYISLYENAFEIHTADISEVLGVVCEKFGFSLSAANEISVFDTILQLINSLTIQEDGIAIIFNQCVTALSFELVDGGIHFGLDVDAIADMDIVLKTADVLPITQPTATLNKDDLYQVLDDVFYIIELIQGNAVHFEISDAVLSFQTNDGENDVFLNGCIDVLWNKEGYQVVGHIVVDGFGLVVALDVLLDGDDLYLTVSNQTIYLKVSEFQDFIQETTELLSSIFPMKEMETASFEGINFADLGLLISASSIQASLEQFIGKTCEIVIGFMLVEEGLSTSITGAYDSMIRFSLPIVVNSSAIKEVEIPTQVITKEDILEILTYVVELYELTLEKEFNFNISTAINTDGNRVAEIEGAVSVRLLENQEFDAHLSLVVREYQNNEQSGWHQLDVQVISLSTLQSLGAEYATAMIFATYGNNPNDLTAVVKAKSTYEGIEDLITSITELLNINISSSAFDMTNQNIDLRNAIEFIHVSKEQISLGIPANFLFESMQDEQQVISISLQKNAASKLSSIELSNLYVSYTNQRSFTKLDTLKIQLADSLLDISLPADAENYYDVSNLSYMVEAFYNNALEKSFEISGTVTLTALSIVNINMPILLKIQVDENGAPILYAHLDMTNIGIGSLLMTKKNIYIYYKDEYVYIHRDDSKDANDRKIKIHYTEFLDNMVYYLMDYAMGLPESIISLINKTPEGDGFVDAAQCINDIHIGESEFMFNLNLKEIADNNDLGKLAITLASSLVAKTDEAGNYVLDQEGNIVFVPMITSIPNFEFVAVDVINLNSKSLVLSNIRADGNGNPVVYDVFLDELNAYIADFDANYASDEEYIYSNGAWISNGKLKHNVVFDLAEAGTSVRKYSENDKIDFPYVEGSIVQIETEEGTKVYQVLGWYLDASYLKPLKQFDSIFMGNKSLIYYAKLEDITIQMEIHSAFDDVQMITTYKGANISSLIEELYSIKTIDGVTYKFSGLFNEQEEIDVNTLECGSYVLTAHWDEVQYSFNVIYNDHIVELQNGDETIFLDTDYAIAKNNEYLVYASDKLTPNYILQNFASLFVFNEELERFELTLIDLNDLRFNSYDLITFETPREELNTKGYYGFFIPKASPKDISELLPNGAYDTFEMNAWISNSIYYSLNDIKEMTGSHHLSAYVSTKLCYFEFESIDAGATISAYTGSSETVIFPEYALLGGKYVPVVDIKEMTDENKENCSAFTGLTTMRTLVFNESLAHIGSNAFKNCDGLENIYFPSALLASNVAKDAFYFVKTGVSDFEKALKQATKLQFHCSSIQAEELNLLACKYNKSKERYYGKVASEFMGIGKADLTHSFVQEAVCISDISNTILKNL